MVDKVTTPMSDGAMTPEKQAEHDAAMTKVAEEGATSLSSVDSRDGKEGNNVELTQVKPAEGEVAKRPDDVPEKFWDTDKGEVNVTALLKSQQDGEATIRAAQKPAEGTTEGTTEDTTVSAEQTTAVNDATTEFAEKGELSADTYATLEKSGLSKDMVNDYIEGQQAIVSSLQSTAYGEFGGKEGYEKAVAWAQENLTDEEIKTIDVQITSRSTGIVKQGAAALAAKFAAGADITPDTTIAGGGNVAPTGAGFKSSAEMQSAMSDPKYKVDAAFRADVARKIDNATKAGVKLFV